jgi:hypothetical protein
LKTKKGWADCNQIFLRVSNLGKSFYINNFLKKEKKDPDAGRAEGHKRTDNFFDFLKGIGL